MAEEPSKTPGTSAEHPSPQIIPLSKIHDLPGVFIPKQPDKSYGGLVSSIQASGVKEPVILRLREDGEYQLVAGYRRRRGSELAKKQDIPAFVYEMTLQEAVDYHRRVQNQPALPIPGKLVNPTAEKKTEQPAPATVSIPKEPAVGKTEGKTADAPKETVPAKDSPAPKEGKVTPTAPAADTPKPKEKPTEGKPETRPDGKAADTPKETAPAKNGPTPKEGKTTPATPAADAPKPKEQPAAGKTEALAAAQHQRDHEHGGDGLEALLQSQDVCWIWASAWLGTGDFRQRTARQRKWICGAERGRSPSAGAAKGVDCLIYRVCCPVGCRLVAGFVAAKWRCGYGKCP